MQKIAILTDSASDLTKELTDKYNIYVVPFKIIYNNKEYEDNVTISADEVYSRMPDEIPTTSLPSNDSIEKILTKLEDEGYTHLISINISSHLSGTSNAIRLILEDHPKLKSFVYDTKTLTVAEGNIAVEAAKMVMDGFSFEDIIKELPNLRKKYHVYFTLNTLEYLKKGGRIGRVSGTIGELLKLKPLIVVNDDGIYDTYAKLRGRKQSLKKLLEVAENHLSKGKCNIWVIDGCAKDEGNAVYEKLKDYPNVNNIYRGTLGPSLGIHTGPGLLGLAIEEVDN